METQTIVVTDVIRRTLRGLLVDEFGADDRSVAALDRVGIGPVTFESFDSADCDESDLTDGQRVWLAAEYYFDQLNPFDAVQTSDDDDCCTSCQYCNGETTVCCTDCDSCDRCAFRSRFPEQID